MRDVKRSSPNNSRLRRQILVPGTFLVALLAAPHLAEACAVCYGAADSGMTQGMNNGILVLLGIITLVQIGFVALFWSFRQRARQVREQEERFQVIQGGAG